MAKDIARTGTRACVSQGVVEAGVRLGSSRTKGLGVRGDQGCEVKVMVFKVRLGAKCIEVRGLEVRDPVFVRGVEVRARD